MACQTTRKNFLNTRVCSSIRCGASIAAMLGRSTT